MSTSWFAVKLLLGNFTKKAVLANLDRHAVALRRENRPAVRENPVTGRARQVVAIRSTISA